MSIFRSSHFPSNSSRSLGLTRIAPVAAIAVLAAVAGAPPGSAAESAATVTGTVSVNRVKPAASLDSGAITTKSNNELLLAFLAVDGPKSSKQSFRSVRGCGLGWTLVARANKEHGAAEIWQARAAARLTRCVVTARVLVGAQTGAVTIVSFADASVGNKVAASGAKGNPKARVHGKAGSLLFGVGVDADGAARRTMPRGQHVVAQLPAAGMTAWTQRATVPMPATATVTMGASEPKGHKWNFAVVEVRRNSTKTIRAAFAFKDHRPRLSSSPKTTAPAPSPTTSAAATASPTPVVSSPPVLTSPAPSPTTSVTTSPAPVVSSPPVVTSPAPSPTTSVTTSPAPVVSSPPAPAGTLALSTNTPATTSLGVSVVAPAGTVSVRLGWTEAGTGRSWNAVYAVGGLPARLTGLVAGTGYDVFAAAIVDAVEASAVHVAATTASLTTTSPAPTSSAPAPSPTSSAPAPSPSISSAPVVAGGFPTVATTGVPSGTTLAASDTIVASSAGQVIDSKNVTGVIEVRAANVVIQRTRVNAGTAMYAVRVFAGASVTMTDVEIIGAKVGIAFENWTCVRCNVHGQTQDGAKIHSNSRIEASIVWDLKPEQGAHADALQMQGGSSNMIIRGNSLDPRSVSGATGGDPQGNSAIILKPDFGNGTGPILVENNLLAGGNYTFYFVRGTSGGDFVQTGATFRNNVWVRGSWRYGPASINMACTASGNKYNDGTALTIC